MHSSITQLPTGIYGITDPTLLSGDALFTGVEQALQGGCKVIQYRDKLSRFDDCLENAIRLKAICEEYNVPLVINDNLNLAIESDAHGLHLGKSDSRIDVARRALGPNKIIGVTCHSDLDYAKNCINSGATYCAFGRFFVSKTKPEAPPCDMAVLKSAIKLNSPIVAIGGINVDNIALFSDTPPHNIAVINSLFGQDDIYSAAKRLSTAFNRIQSD